MNFAYFVGGCLGAIAFSNFLKLMTRIFPTIAPPITIAFAVVALIGLAYAVLRRDMEQGLTVWFLSICGLGLGVMLGAF